MKTKPRKRTARKKSAGSTSRKARRWSAKVTRTSHAMDLRSGVFASDDPKAIARSVKRSSERSHRRKAGAYRSAVSMISFYENRAGKKLSARKRRILQQAKTALKQEFGREPDGDGSPRKRSHA